jgi:hypothetical protein
MDRLKLQVQKSGDEAVQNAYYNCWLHDHLVGSVLSSLLPDHGMIQQLQKMVDFTLS